MTTRKMGLYFSGIGTTFGFLVWAIKKYIEYIDWSLLINKGGT